MSNKQANVHFLFCRMQKSTPGYRIIQVKPVSELQVCRVPASALLLKLHRQTILNLYEAKARYIHMHVFDIYFAGKIAAGQDLAKVKARIGSAFRLSDAKLDALFCGDPVRIKANLNAEEAGKYRKVFLDAGCLIEIVPAGSDPQGPEPSPAPSSQQEQTSDGIQLLPANTGSLIDTARPVAEFDLSSADHLSLMPADETPADNSNEPSFDWDGISQIEILPANTGSLADCVEEKKAVPIPDISSMKLVE